VVSPPDRALFDRLPRLVDLVPFVELADGLPTAVEQPHERLWVQRDDRSSSVYGGNKVRKLEFLLPIAQRRGGPVLTAGGTGSHHVLATAIHAGRLGIEVEAVQYPQPETDDVRHTREAVGALGVSVTRCPNAYLMPAVLAARLAALAPRRPYLLWPGASTPIGSLGYVSAGLELVHALRAARAAEPDDVVVPLGSGGSAVGLALGLALGGWKRARVVAVRVADRVVTNVGVLRSLEAGTAAVLAAGGWLPRPAVLTVDGRWFGKGYGHPTAEGDIAMRRAPAFGLELEPTYTAKAFAAALELLAEGRRVVFVQTFAGGSHIP
jgi:D-cysteine desulfhydrase